MAVVKLTRSATIKDNIPGLQGKVYVALMSEFDVISSFMTVVAMGDEVTVADDHTFLTGKGFLSMELDFKKNNFEGKKAADWGSNNKQWTVKGTFHGTGKQCAAFASYLNNADLMLLVKRLTTAATPDVLQFGLENMPARLIDEEWKSGTADAGSASVEFTFEAFQPHLVFYGGDITEKP